MHELGLGSTDVMISEFLRQEYASTVRYGEHITKALNSIGATSDLITNPNLDDPEENEQRRSVLREFKGYGSGKSSYLTDFPTTGVVWRWMTLTPEELLDCKYIRYEFWSELSAKTRSPRVAADRIVRNQIPETEVYQEARIAFLGLSELLRHGASVPPLILVSADGGRTRVVLEGHTRLTGFALSPESIPEPITVLLGTSPEIARWDEY